MSNKHLTPRQIQMVQLLCEGRSQKQIASDLGISLFTLGHYFTHAYDRTGARGQVQLALWAVKNGYVKL